ncbi:hypothetical protein N7582_005707 [Saccharomyces uvarum]|uniref:Uncharacterized protein n=1 Tax=Saccharomyces uvarum TaxID=230603 RepID=A0AA35JBN7_SACUV|nr:hypothetical protein N7582_005707 [Saccharomyces uvarum]CAI4053373.1 hypothetical protein SUVC_16G2770 [Saccharomyces uvarum]
MYLKASGLHDYTLKNLMYENNFCKFYDAVDEKDTSYVLKFIPSNMHSDEDPFPFIDCFQVEEGIFFVYASNNFAKEGPDYFTYGSSSGEENISVPSTQNKPRFIEVAHPKHQKLDTKEQKKKNAITDHSSGKKTPNPDARSFKEQRREANVEKVNIESNKTDSAKIRSGFICPIIETNYALGLPSILLKENISYPSNVHEKHISIVNPSLQIYHSSHKQIVKTPVPKNGRSPVEKFSFKGQDFKCYSPRPLKHKSPECDVKSNIELRLLQSSMLQRRQSAHSK